MGSEASKADLELSEAVKGLTTVRKTNGLPKRILC
jgi:hypothetical protein